MDEYQELNAREEQDIEIMMEGCECAISNAEAFAEKLSRELQVLDGVRMPHAGSEWCMVGCKDWWRCVFCLAISAFTGRMLLYL